MFLDDCDLHPRVRDRIGLTLDVIGDQAAATHRIESLGEARVDRLVSLVLLGDLVSIYMAVLAGRDPAAIVPIERLKAALAAQRRLAAPAARNLDTFVVGLPPCSP